MISEQLQQSIADIVTSEAAGRWVSAAMRLTLLREHYEAFDTETLAADEQSWEAFAAKHIPLPSHRVHELIGKMVHGGGMLCCSSCDAKVKSACHCGAPYVGEHRWAAPAPVRLTLRERITAAIIADPGMSDRAVAAQIGCDHKTVGKARRALMVSPQNPQQVSA